MNLTFDFDDSTNFSAKMKVVGVGGAGGNAINRMIHEGLAGVDFIAVNTDEQALEICDAANRVRIGTKATQGLGAGADPERGRRAVEEDRNAVYEALADADMVFVTAGMGGGTGTGAAPIVAEIARDIGALTVGIVTKPFLFEGPKRMQRAEEGIRVLKEQVDTLIVIPNQRLLSIVPDDTPLDAAFRYADKILFDATKGISDLISVPGLVNLDFADVRAVMSEMGDALMGSGSARGENRARVAAEQAITSPLLENVSISGALGVLVNITGGPDMTLQDVNVATTIVFEESGQNANIIFGAVVDKDLKEELQVTVIATGLSDQRGRRRIPGLNRPAMSSAPAPSSSVNKREIPAIDRIDEINEELSKETNSRLADGQHPKFNGPRKKTPKPNGHSTLDSRPMPRESDDQFVRSNGNDPLIERERNGTNGNGHDEGVDNQNGNGFSQREQRLRRFSRGSDSNGVSEDDYEIPTYRRKRWNLL